MVILGEGVGGKSPFRGVFSGLSQKIVLFRLQMVHADEETFQCLGVKWRILRPFLWILWYTL